MAKVSAEPDREIGKLENKSLPLIKAENSEKPKILPLINTVTLI